MDPLFERSAPAVREIFEALLRLVREVMPDAREQLDLPDHLVAFGFGPPGGVRMRGLAVGLVPHATTLTCSSRMAPTCLIRAESRRARESASAT